MKTKYVIFVAVLLMVATFVAWTVAPSEKVIYKDRVVEKVVEKEPTYKNEIGDMGYIAWGDSGGKRGKIVAVSKFYTVVRLDDGYNITIETSKNGNGNFIPEKP